ncbi:AAA family ATPase [Labrys wisconsinensis]|uniref:ATPase n=1 Tax=Labrys wisconsinensis TaxID=425677 RepID=A0ABU0J8S0_9HYPH|nr:AAA family ATPase [Labrys wisconsinensis]MDQ0470675.1 putative ATPase [Labrys wisconsinensis]
MSAQTDRFFVLTGGPGSGKSTLIAALERAGHACMPEAGRAVIQDQMRIDGPALPWRDPAAFAELMLGLDMRSHAMAGAAPGPVFFDRGVPDVPGYLALTGLPVPGHMQRAAETVRYNRLVFIAPPWPAIFGQDAERRQDFDEAVRTHAAMAAIYGELGYELVELPLAPVEARLAFVRAHLPFACGT